MVEIFGQPGKVSWSWVRKLTTCETFKHHLTFSNSILSSRFKQPGFHFFPGTTSYVLWENCLIFCLNFFICKMGIIFLTSRVVKSQCKNKTKHIKGLKQCLMYKNSINIRFCNCFFNYFIFYFLWSDLKIVKMGLIRPGFTEF